MSILVTIESSLLNLCQQCIPRGSGITRIPQHVTLVPPPRTPQSGFPPRAWHFGSHRPPRTLHFGVLIILSCRHLRSSKGRRAVSDTSSLPQTDPLKGTQLSHTLQGNFISQGGWICHTGSDTWGTLSHSVPSPIDLQSPFVLPKSLALAPRVLPRLIWCLSLSPEPPLQALHVPGHLPNVHEADVLWNLCRACPSFIPGLSALHLEGQGQSFFLPAS